MCKMWIYQEQRQGKWGFHLQKGVKVIAENIKLKCDLCEQAIENNIANDLSANKVYHIKCFGKIKQAREEEDLLDKAYTTWKKKGKKWKDNDSNICSAQEIALEIGIKKGKKIMINKFAEFIDKIESGCANQDPMWFSCMECCKDELKKSFKEIK